MTDQSGIQISNICQIVEQSVIQKVFRKANNQSIVQIISWKFSHSVEFIIFFVILMFVIQIIIVQHFLPKLILFYLSTFCLHYTEDLNNRLVITDQSVRVWSKLVQPNGLVFKYHLITRLNLVRYSGHHLNTGPVFECWSQYRTTS